MELHQSEDYKALASALRLPVDEDGRVLPPMSFWREVLWHIKHWWRSR